MTPEAHHEIVRKRRQFHAVFDRLWKEGLRPLMGRQKAYAALAAHMNISLDECHAGKFNHQQCQIAIEWSNKTYRECRKQAKRARRAAIDAAPIGLKKRMR